MKPNERRRLLRFVSTYLQAIGGIVTVLIVLSPKWGPPGDFYLGYPVRFYVTQYDVLYSFVNVITLLWDLTVVGVPVFGFIFAFLWILDRILPRNAQS